MLENLSPPKHEDFHLATLWIWRILKWGRSSQSVSVKNCTIPLSGTLTALPARRIEVLARLLQVSCAKSCMVSLLPELHSSTAEHRRYRYSPRHVLYMDQSVQLNPALASTNLLGCWYSSSVLSYILKITVHHLDHIWHNIYVMDPSYLQRRSESDRPELPDDRMPSTPYRQSDRHSDHGPHSPPTPWLPAAPRGDVEGEEE